MSLIQWDALPSNMRNEETLLYYRLLQTKTITLRIKRVLDLVLSLILSILLMPIIVLLGILIKLDSPGSIFFRQERVTQYGKIFRICKFRTMVENAEKLGAGVTANKDDRITKVGNFLRKSRLDEIPQLINVIKGEMTFVGTRPELPKYVAAYTNEMMATLLLPAGITSKASINFRNEAEFLINAGNIEEVYVKEILPRKMQYNLAYLREISTLLDLRMLVQTLLVVI